jgi:cell wall-associated NlpC family hydrolase
MGGAVTTPTLRSGAQQIARPRVVSGRMVFCLVMALVVLFAGCSIARASSALDFSGTLSSSHVLRVRGTVRLAQPGVRVRLETRSRISGAWSELGKSRPVRAHGAFSIVERVIGRSLAVRVVVLRGHVVVMKSPARNVRRRPGHVTVITPTPTTTLVPPPVSADPSSPGTSDVPPVDVTPAPTPSTLHSGESLSPGSALASPNHQYELIMQGDGNLVLYHNGVATWSTGGQGAGSSLTMQSDGDLVVYNGGSATWNSNTSGFPSAELTLQDDGNAVIYHAGNAIWTAGGGYRGDKMDAGTTLRPGAYLLSPNHQYELVMQPADGNLVLYHDGQALWSTGGQGAGTSVTMQGDGNLVMYNDGTAMWSSNTSGFAGAQLFVQDDGNAVIYHTGHAVWTWSGGYIGYRMDAGATLSPGAYLLSPNHQYELVMQPADGNLVLYHDGQALWSTGGTGAGSSLTMQGDGNLVTYNDGIAKWSSGTAGYPGSSLVLQDDANLVIYQSGAAIWTRGSTNSDEGQAIVQAAAKWAGTQYCWDGGNQNGPTHGTTDPENGIQCATGTVGFDCTGLTLYAVYQVTGILLPHSTGQDTGHGGTPVARADLQPGDLVFFGPSLANYTHAGVYIGNNQMWDAQTEGVPVQVHALYSNYVGATRYR